ncbi:MAG TPA: hypothetical protein VNG71_04410 [Pyrinomonadaceae bacterium]|nr:hypothetical protein [Pyrinomonadaceae bacterium]
MKEFAQVLEMQGDEAKKGTLRIDFQVGSPGENGAHHKGVDLNLPLDEFLALPMDELIERYIEPCLQCLRNAFESEGAIR